LTAAFSPDGTRFLTGGGTLVPERGEARLWDRSTRKPVGDPLVYNRPIAAVAFSPDGATFLTGGGDQIVRIYERDTGRLRLSIPHPHAVLAAAFSPDGQVLLTGSGTVRSDEGYNVGDAHLWDVATGRGLDPAIHVGRAILGVAFSPRGDTFLTARWREAQLWEARTRRPLGRPFLQGDWIRPAVFSPDGQTILTGGADHHARLWDVATRRPIGPPLRHGWWVTCGAFSPDGRTIATGSMDHTARIREAPAPFGDRPERLGLWAEVITGMSLNDDGTPQDLEEAVVEERRARLHSLGGPPQPRREAGPSER
jgi:WD40 repeat protein